MLSDNKEPKKKKHNARDDWGNIPIPNELIKRLDAKLPEMIKTGKVRSRAELVRMILSDWLDQHQ